ncbi:MAG: hypothetical protein JWQ74_192 [Marmoricola sp.]|nr:hypothetical protein [Marmoricola sp.]
MFKILLALHLFTAIFAVGPLVHATTTAARGLRTADAKATASSARTATIYSYASLLVVVLGFGLMSTDNPYRPGDAAFATFGDTWIWLSALLWVIAVGLTLGLLVPALEQATERIDAGQAVDDLKAKVAAPGGVVALIFTAIVFLMVYQPGS